MNGFSAQDLWRMKQSHEVFSADPKLSVMPKALSSTDYCILLRPTAPVAGTAAIVLDDEDPELFAEDLVDERIREHAHGKAPAATISR